VLREQSAEPADRGEIDRAVLRESRHIVAVQLAEALYALELERFPAVVIIDRAGRNFHEESRARWRRTSA
jgi:tartrate dehydratase beta subunit/fumarate hydratase class I family protein